MTLLNWRPVLSVFGLVLSVQAAALLFLGQPLTCTCGYVKFWEGAVTSIGNSQHFADWYTLTHVLHGFIFYYVLGLFFPRLSAVQKMCIAICIEGAWEVMENTPWVIEHYREQALARGYVGDSVINSLSDTISMCLGLFIAYTQKPYITLAIALVLEAIVGYAIHDGLLLNLLNFAHQFDWIASWQAEKLWTP